MIVFNAGEENRVVIEDTGDNAFFRIQYGAAESMLKRIEKSLDVAKDREKGMLCASNVIAFCGDRGTGKTSCMMSFREKYKEEFLTLDMIDPSFFDDDHNIIDLVLGSLYDKMYELKNDASKDFRNPNELYRAFSRVKSCLKDLEKSREQMYDALEDVVVMNAGMKLCERFRELIRLCIEIYNTNKGTHVKHLLITIDDIDTKTTGTYKMAEQIRKYLCQENCVILISVNTSQLRQQISQDLAKDYIGKGFDSMYMEMAEKYVTKFIPNDHCVNMPSFDNYLANSLEIKNFDGTTYEYESIKDGVLQLIFKKTRYLFYNTIDETNPIVPRNLRKLRQLVSLLISMNDFAGNERSIANKMMFKSYFFEQWKDNIGAKDIPFVTELENWEDIQTLNKYVVRYLNGKIVSSVSQARVNTSYMPLREEEIDYVKLITAQNNYSYNVSVGDVFYIMNHLKFEAADDNSLRMLLFYLRSYYSMLLYESYDEISEQKGKLFPISNEQNPTIKRDAWFNETNKLQRLLNGAYFTYASKTIFPNNGEEFGIVDGEEIMKFVLSHNKLEINTNQWDDKFLALEFVMLITKGSVDNVSKMSDYENVVRTLSRPAYVKTMNRGSDYVYDIMAIFTNIVNIKQCYRRFWGDDSFFIAAKDCKDSLLNKMSVASFKQWVKNGIDDDVDKNMACLLSNSVLRNVDIVSNIIERAEYIGANVDKANQSLVYKMQRIYEGLIDIGMNTYVYKASMSYALKLTFLEPIAEMLKSNSIEIILKEWLKNNDNPFA